MQILSFQNPVKIEFGQGVRNKIGSTLAKQYKTILMLCAKGIPEEFFKDLHKDLSGNGIKVVLTENVDSNPRISTVRIATKMCIENDVEAIVALGGGSALDCAKMTAASAATGIDVKDFLWGETKEITASLPVITVPTIAATGTELNNTAVIRDEVTKKKSSCAALSMYPEYSFIDPYYAQNLPTNIMRWGAMDVLSHTFEYYFNGYNSPFQLRFSEGIILAAMECITELAEHGYDLFYYGELMWTSAMTWGTGLTRIGRGLPDMACHTIEEGIGAFYDTHHGAGLGVITPNWMRYVYKKSPEIFARFARNIFGVTERDDVLAAKMGIECFEKWLEKVNMETSYRQLCDKITDEKLQEIADDIYEDSNGVVGRLVPLSKQDILEILKLSCK